MTKAVAVIMALISIVLRTRIVKLVPVIINMRWRTELVYLSKDVSIKKLIITMLRQK